VRNKIGILSILLLLGLLYACANTNSLPRVHPENVGHNRPDCTECHTDSWSALNHRAPDFIAKHRFYAGTARQVCSSCHTESFCADCHAHRDEIKPSDKFSDDPLRTLPHRGDYMSQHKIDGRVNPISCVKCHGRQNNERCASCHR
jgi:hypothetical protein